MLEILWSLYIKAMGLKRLGDVGLTNINFGQLLGCDGLELAERFDKGGFVWGLKRPTLHLEGHKPHLDFLSFVKFTYK